MAEKISVIVPIYNVEKYLKRCVESILKQTYQNIEVILVDDGSSDGSGKICDQFAERDDRIKVIHKKNGGMSDARNAGLDMATGEYIAFVDSDDWISSVMFERLYAALKKHGTELVVCEPIYAYETYIDEQQLSGKSFELNKREAMELLIEDRKFRSVVWNKLYAKRLWSDIRFPKGKHYEDVHIVYKIYDMCEKIAFLDQGLYYYFQRSQSIVHSANIESHMELVYAVEERAKFLQLKYPDMLPRLSASVISAVLIVYREAGIYQIKLDKDTKKYMRKKIDTYKNKDMFQYLSPRMKIEYILYLLTPDGLVKASKCTEKITKYLKKRCSGRKNS